MGYPVARYNMDLLNLKSGSATNVNKAEIFYRIQRFAKSGFPRAQGNLAWLYFYGIGTKKDEIAAKKWFEKAKSGGYSPGAFFTKVLR